MNNKGNRFEIIKRKKPGRPVKVPRPPVEELAALYEKHTMRELGEHYGVSYSLVKTWIHYYRNQCE